MPFASVRGHRTCLVDPRSSFHSPASVAAAPLAPLGVCVWLSLTAKGRVWVFNAIFPLSFAPFLLFDLVWPSIPPFTSCSWGHVLPMDRPIPAVFTVLSFLRSGPSFCPSLSNPVRRSDPPIKVVVRMEGWSFESPSHRPSRWRTSIATSMAERHRHQRRLLDLPRAPGAPLRTRKRPGTRRSCWRREAWRDPSRRRARRRWRASPSCIRCAKERARRRRRRGWIPF